MFLLQVLGAVSFKTDAEICVSDEGERNDLLYKITKTTFRKHRLGLLRLV